MSSRDGDQKLVQDAIQTLVEHFDAVQIFASRHEQGESAGTVYVSEGRGNWYARYGQVRTWLLNEEDVSRNIRQGDQQ